MLTWLLPRLAFLKFHLSLLLGDFFRGVADCGNIRQIRVRRYNKYVPTSQERLPAEEEGGGGPMGDLCRSLPRGQSSPAHLPQQGSLLC